MTGSLQPDSPYAFKASPYSSHSLLLSALPERGEGRRVLDLGCGDGYLAERLAARGYDVTGVERFGGVSDSFPRSVRLVVADLDVGLPLFHGQYEYIICADVLEHLRAPIKLLRGLRPLLAPGGRLFASLPNSANLYFRVTVMLGRFPKDARGLFDRTHLHFFAWQGWSDVFQIAGYHMENVRPAGVPVGLAFPRWDGTAAARFLEWLSYVFARIWKKMFAYQFVVSARPLPDQT